MRLARRLTLATTALTLGLCLCVEGAQARQKSRRARRPAPAKKQAAETPQSELARLREQYIEATREVKAALILKLEAYEPDVKKADEKVTKTLELYRAGLVSKKDLERDEQAAEAARSKVAAIEGELKNADSQIAETLVEIET